MIFIALENYSDAFKV